MFTIRIGGQPIPPPLKSHDRPAIDRGPRGQRAKRARRYPPSCFLNLAGVGNRDRIEDDGFRAGAAQNRSKRFLMLIPPLTPYPSEMLERLGPQLEELSIEPLRQKAAGGRPV
jgi:hypothetical protein